MPNQTIGMTFKTDAGVVPITAIAIVVDSEINEAVFVGAGATREVDVTFAHTPVVAYCLTLLNALGKAEATAGAVTVKANSSGAPDYTMTLAPKQPAWYASALGATSPAKLISTDTTKLYLVNTGTADVTVAVHIGSNLAV